MEQFASGWKQSYYGKGDVTVYRLNRSAPASAEHAVFGASVLMLIYGNAFWATYTKGDNTGLIATDSMKNFIQRETMNFDGYDLEAYCRFLAEKFIAKYPQVEGMQVSADEIPYQGLPGLAANAAFAPGGPERARAQIEIGRKGIIEATSGLRGFRLLRLGGSAFKDFVRDEYTTLPDLDNRPLHMWLDLEWRYMTPDAALTDGAVTARARQIIHEVFATFESGSIQQVIHQMGAKLLVDVPTMAEVHLEANNRTWDTIAEKGDALGVYTDARPPYGCLGLTLKRETRK
jgi:urate oxidase/2-oxo-4-hydroxy-4-carboxy-5-ureidoimidazoline decarboxylase